MSDITPYTDSELAVSLSDTRNPVNPFNSSVPRHIAKRLLWLPDSARNMGINLRGAKGSGKSTLMAMLAWFDLIRNVPLVILDPVGGVLDGLIFRICRLPRELQQQLWPRIRYVNMAAHYGHVTPLPLYYRLGNESLYTISQRYPDVIRRVDPWLNSAPIQGFNSLWKISTYTGMALTALDCQITEAEDLLRNPQNWLPRLSQAVTRYSELQPVIDFFQEYSRWNEQLRSSRTEMFLTKIAPFILDPAMKAMFGANTQGIKWDEAVDKSQAVLLDFRNVADHETRRFKLIWCLQYFLDFVRHRGAGRGAGHKPIALYIDELASLFHMQSMDVNPLQEDLDELINMRMRSHMIWGCFAYQEAYQLDERTQKTLLTLGTQIFGSTADMDTALAIAKQFFPIDPYMVKRTERVFGSMFGMPQILDHRPVEFTVEEQQMLNSYKVKDQGAFNFLVRPAQGEGTATGGVYPITIRNFDKGIWPDPVLVEQARALLSKRCGFPIEQVLAEIEAHRQTIVHIEAASSAKINGYGTNNKYSKSNEDNEYRGYARSTSGSSYSGSRSPASSNEGTLSGRLDRDWSSNKESTRGTKGTSWYKDTSKSRNKWGREEGEDILRDEKPIT